MKNITTKQFCLLTDEGMVWELMTETYEPLCMNGMEAPFFEYYVTSSYVETQLLSRDRIWLDNGKAVGIVFFESSVTEIYFILKRGYEELAPEMVRYAAEKMPGGEKTFVLSEGQTALRKAAEEAGFTVEGTESTNTIDLGTASLDYPLPEGYHFVKPEYLDTVKLTRCLWSGFNDSDIDPAYDFTDLTADDPVMELFLAVDGNTLAPPPHSTYDLNVVIADEKEDYVCFSGMWWVEKNKVAYMEPLCTVPAHRGKGLAAAALSEHCRRMKALGAEYMTGGGNIFYKKIGYNCEDHWLRLTKPDGETR